MNKMKKNYKIIIVACFVFILIVIFISGCRKPEIEPYLYCRIDNDCVLTDSGRIKSCCETGDMQHRAMNKMAYQEELNLKKEWYDKNCKDVIMGNITCASVLYKPPKPAMAICEDNICTLKEFENIKEANEFEKNRERWKRITGLFGK